MKTHMLLAAATLLAVSGCGLDDYEKRMDVERRRVDIFDKEEAHLGGFVEAPPSRKIKNKDKEEDVPAWPFEVYLRVPIGFDRTSTPEQYEMGDLFLYRFLCNLEKPAQDKPDVKIKEGWNMFVACSKVGEMDKKSGTFKAGELSQGEFQQRILKVLRKYYRAEYKKSGRDYEFPYSLPKSEKFQPEFVKERLKDNKDPPAVEVETLEFLPKDKDSTAFQLYFHRNGANQIAVIFQLPEAATKDPKFVPGRNYCLKSLDISENAILKKNEYVRSHRAVPKKTAS